MPYQLARERVHAEFLLELADAQPRFCRRLRKAHRKRDDKTRDAFAIAFGNKCGFYSHIPVARNDDKANVGVLCK